MDGVTGGSGKNGNAESHESEIPSEAGLENVMKALKVPEGRPLNVVGVGAGAWGAVFISMLQKEYFNMKDKIKFSIYRREGKELSKETASKILEVINADSEVIRRLRQKGRYFKYVDARLGERVLSAAEVLTDGFCENMLDLPLMPLRVITDLTEAVWDADVIVNSIPSSNIRPVFEVIGNLVRERGRHPVVISLAKGIEYKECPEPHVLTPSGIIHDVTGIPKENIFYLGGPNIASEVWKGEYATARICGLSKTLRRALASLIRNDSFVVWDNPDIVNHEIMGGLKNVYAIGAGIIKGAAKNSATSMAVYFSNACAEMVFISQLLTGVRDPVYLTGPLLADVYVTLLKGRNAWYGEQVALGNVNPENGPYVPGKGLIEGVGAVGNFHRLLSDSRLTIPDPKTEIACSPIALLPTLSALNDVFSRKKSEPLLTSKQKLRRKSNPRKPQTGFQDPGQYFLAQMKDATATDPEARLHIFEGAHLTTQTSNAEGQ
ncbi:hypothetical protein NDN08_005091 [Rhodosorus marinus]|uniref:Glycerol-3-phosphate dehydrogenase [NAD(+)] n=1 Tax=Rhodosorus marinus TaxID=101924 RepID=A0AAV8V4C4_9RHOD|nr:hypothetical protein NDN08_005091 [Rhodosorus marinus]